MFRLRMRLAPSQVREQFLAENSQTTLANRLVVLWHRHGINWERIQSHASKSTLLGDEILSAHAMRL